MFYGQCGKMIDTRCENFQTSYSGYPQRSRSAAPTDTPSMHYRSRSKSPTRVYERSLSPTSHRYLCSVLVIPLQLEHELLI